MARKESSLPKTRPEPALQPAGGDPTAADAASKPVTALNPGLYIVATPIGNLGDITARALDVLRAADTVACEDTRVTGVLLQRFGISTPMIPYHDHNAARVRPQLLAKLSAGGRIALVSDAGTPLISDPGYKLVRACADAGVAVVPVPGASALLAALVTAGLPTDRVMFAGFLPQKSAARREALLELKDLKATLVFYEAANRTGDTLTDIDAVLGPRATAVCRELTKLYEEIRRGTAGELARHYETEGTPKGEVVIVVAGAGAVTVSAADIDDALHQAMTTMSVRDAAAVVAEAFHEPKRRVYQRALELSKDVARR